MSVKHSFMIILPIVALMLVGAVGATITGISLTSPGNATWTTDATPDFVFNATSDSNATLGCELFINGTGYGANSSAANDTSTTITANASLADGSHSWYINCTDTGTNQSEARTLNVDATAPAASLSFPPYASGTADITGYANDTNFANWTLALYQNNTLLNATFCNGTAAVNGTLCSWNTSLACSGECDNYTLSLVVADLAGSSAVNASTAIDNVAPVLNITSPTAASKSYRKAGASLTVSIKYTDHNPKNVTIYLLNQSNATVNSTVVNASLTAGTNKAASASIALPSNASEGERYNIKVVLYDGAGASAEDSELNATVVDNTKPNITRFTLSDTSPIKGDSVTWTCTATDNYDTNVTRTVSGLSTSSIGTRNATCTATDDAGNSATMNKSYTVSASVEAGGGGGGGAETGAELSQTFSSVANGSSISLPVAISSIAVTNVNITVEDDASASNVGVTVTAVTTPSFTTPVLNVSGRSGRVYAYTEIDVTNLQNADIDAAIIKFKVPKSWLASNNFTVGDIALYRLRTSWQALSTRNTSEDNSTVYFEADTTGFSLFAIFASTPIITITNETANETANETNETNETAACTANSTRCLGNASQSCVNETWTTAENCTYGCNATTFVCNAASSAPPAAADYTLLIVAIIIVAAAAGVIYYIKFMRGSGFKRGFKYKYRP